MKQWGGDQNYRPEKHDKEKKTRRSRRRDRDRAPEKKPQEAAEEQSQPTERDYRVGKTIAGATDQSRKRDLEHIAARKKRLRRNVIVVTGILAMIAIILASLTRSIADNVSKPNAADAEAVKYPTEPTVMIIDENVGENISTRVKTFVARLEADATDYGIKVERVLLPLQKAREIHVYLAGRNEYYKMTTERGSTVQAEDASRMVRYLDEKGLTPEYVDIRLAGKAYYK